MGCPDNTEHETSTQVVGGQRVDEEIAYPRYLIRATGEGAVMVRHEPDNLFPCNWSSFSLVIMSF